MKMFDNLKEILKSKIPGNMIFHNLDFSNKKIEDAYNIQMDITTSAFNYTLSTSNLIISSLLLILLSG